MMSEWPKLSETLKPAVDMMSCQNCGKECDIERWEECDSADQPTKVVIVICDECSDAIIEKHPRLYRRLHCYEPMPGSMACCLNCMERKGLTCSHPALKRNGGDGLMIAYPMPTVAFIDGVTNGKRWGGRHQIYHAPPDCKRMGLP
jgi:hypothetical protein